MATEIIMATSTTKLTLFHPIRLAHFARFALASLKMRTNSLRSAQFPSWAQTAEKAWGGFDPADVNNTQGILTREFMSGGFTWTGWDYKGEPTPYHWPDINSHFGIYDIAGFDKDRCGWYKSWWNEKTAGDTLFLFPHW